MLFKKQHNKEILQFKSLSGLICKMASRSYVQVYIYMSFVLVIATFFFINCRYNTLPIKPNLTERNAQLNPGFIIGVYSGFTPGLQE